MIQLCRKPPFKSGEQSLLNIHHVDGCLVTGQDDLFAILMQVIENMEEHILCASFTGKQLDVIDNKHIYNLIEMYKVVAIIFLNRFDVLLCELLSRDIQNRFFGVLFLYFDANGMCQVSFSKSYTAEDQQTKSHRVCWLPRIQPNEQDD